MPRQLPYIHWEEDFLLISPDFFPDMCTPLGCLVTSNMTWCCLWANSRAIETKKKRPFIPWDNIFAVPLSQKLCCPAWLIFQVAQVPQTLPVREFLLSPSQRRNNLSAFSDTLGALTQTGKIRSEGCLQCLPSVSFSILLPKETIGAISMPVKKLCLIPWEDGNSD